MHENPPVPVPDFIARLQQLVQALASSKELHDSSFQTLSAAQEALSGQVQKSTVFLLDRIHHVAKNMKFQTGGISNHCEEHSKRLDGLCEGMSSLEHAICGELSELRSALSSRSTVASSRTTVKSQAPVGSYQR